MLVSDWESLEAAAAHVRVLECTHVQNLVRSREVVVYELDCGIFGHSPVPPVEERGCCHSSKN